MSSPVDQRRTFAIIAHPDAGKTTLTEKLLLFGGAIQLAGMVKARGERRRARSDWMKVEQERGISVASSVMTFDYNDITYNLLDTPGHEDFSEDTYRTLTAVDSAIMVLDAAKGIEAQTLKLFAVCRLRNIPIITFVNKMDRESLDPFSLMDEVEDKLQMEVTPASWPIGMGRDFKGCYDLLKDELVLFDRSKGEKLSSTLTCSGLDDKLIDEKLPADQAEKLREDVAMIRGVCPPFDIESYLAGHMTPVFFGSAVNNFGVRELLQGIGQFAPTPRAQKATERLVDPHENKVTGFVFKIQANMDPKHRDRIAFTRLCSGTFKRGMKLYHARSDKQMIIHSPLMFFAQEREMVDEAVAGDIIGIPNHGNLRIGDVLTEGEKLTFTGIPSFAPEYLQKISPEDPLKAKHLGNALQQLAEEGVARVFRANLDNSWIVGVVGMLQFDVLADRIRTEYNLPVKLEPTSLYTARWVSSDDSQKLKNFVDNNRSALALDHDGDPVFMARNAWHLNDTMDKNKDIKFTATK
ncbi:MAG: peptide chain release factor 3 [Pseudobdellovibrionaceae bacterium]